MNIHYLLATGYYLRIMKLPDLYMAIWIILFISVIGVIPVKAQDDKMYLSLPTGDVQVIDINNVQKITFSEQDINFHFKSNAGDIQPISYDTLITFNKPKSSIETLDLGNSRFVRQPPYILIDSDDIILGISVYNIRGIQLINEIINATSTALSLELLSPGVNIICISTQRAKHNFKIVK